MFLIMSQGPRQTLERLPTHNHRRAQMFEILMFTKNTHPGWANYLTWLCVWQKSASMWVGNPHADTDTNTHIQQTPFKQMMQIDDISVLINISDIFDLSIQRLQRKTQKLRQIALCVFC